VGACCCRDVWQARHSSNSHSNVLSVAA
jgi:hypothetical protein